MYLTNQNTDLTQTKCIDGLSALLRTNRTKKNVIFRRLNIFDFQPGAHTTLRLRTYIISVVYQHILFGEILKHCLREYW